METKNIIIANSYSLLLSKLFGKTPSINYVNGGAVVSYDDNDLPYVQDQFSKMLYSKSDDPVKISWYPIVENELYKTATIAGLSLIFVGFLIGRLKK